MEQRDAERKAATEVGMLFPFAAPIMTTHTNEKMLRFLLIRSIFSRPWAIADIFRDSENRNDLNALIPALIYEIFLGKVRK